MIPSIHGKPEVSGSNPDELSKLLELELTEKRIAWKHAASRYRTIRSLAFFFLFLVIAAALLGGFFLFSRVSDRRPNGSVNTATGSQRR